MKTIDTLVSDIYDQVKGLGGWDEAHGTMFGQAMEAASNRRFLQENERGSNLRMSNIGKPCVRQLYYDTHPDDNFKPEELEAHTLFKFFYGDMIEEATLALAKASGHLVEGEQEEVEILGVKGHYDGIIDGMLVDVKSCSPYAFNKFKSNGLRDDDAFGYIPQLSSYLYCLKDDDRVKYKNKAGFLAIDKVNGYIHLDVYDFTPELEWKEVFFQNRIEAVASDEVPNRQFSPVADGKSGNMKLGVGCSYCSHKKRCWPELRSFAYSGGPRYLTTVAKEPNVPEFT